MHDIQWLESSLGHNRSLHEVCRGRALHHCLSGRDVRPPDQYVDSKTWELTNELMRRSQVGQAHSTTYHPQTNSLVERQNRTLVLMVRAYWSRYMTDWDRYLPQVMGAYNSTQHSTTGVSLHMMLTGREKFLSLIIFYPEYEVKKRSPQVYVRDVIRRQQELNDLYRPNTQQAQARQRKRFDKKAAGAKITR